MPKQIENGIATTGGARFDSPLRLWIAIWQRQLVYGTAWDITCNPMDPMEKR
jgi:hypothetical protein